MSSQLANYNLRNFDHWIECKINRKIYQNLSILMKYFPFDRKKHINTQFLIR
jgi:hypothetical protein